MGPVHALAVSLTTLTKIVVGRLVGRLRRPKLRAQLRVARLLRAQHPTSRRRIPAIKRRSMCSRVAPRVSGTSKIVITSEIKLNAA